MILFDDGALADLERILAFHMERDPAAAARHIATIRDAVMILGTHPRIGRVVERGSTLRELVISHGSAGYVALYEHSPGEQLVRVVAVRAQREAGYRDS